MNRLSTLFYLRLTNSFSRYSFFHYQSCFVMRFSFMSESWITVPFETQISLLIANQAKGGITTVLNFHDKQALFFSVNFLQKLETHQFAIRNRHYSNHPQCNTRGNANLTKLRRAMT